MSEKFPEIPLVATDVNYPAGSNTWSGQPTKLAPSGGFEAQGFVPNAAPGAQEINYVLAQQSNGVRDLQRRVALREVNGGEDSTTAAIARYMPLMDCLILGRGANMLYTSRNWRRGKVEGTGAGSDIYAVKGANFRVGTTSKVACFQWNATGTDPSLDVFGDVDPPTHSLLTLPNAGARYTHACTDVTTGQFVAVAGNSIAGANAGFASGDPAALSFAAASGAGAWTAQPNMSCASKPGEVRAFSKSFTFASTDGGATVGPLTATVWSGATPLGNMFPPTWDSLRERWICSVVYMSISNELANANNAIYTSEDGVTWTKLTNSPTSVGMLCFIEHSGYIFAIGRMMGIGATVPQTGLEIFVSADGGLTWRKPGIRLSNASLGFNATDEGIYQHATDIVKAGSHLVFQSAASLAFLGSGGPGVAECTEFEIVAVDGDDYSAG